MLTRRERSPGRGMTGAKREKIKKAETPTAHERYAGLNTTHGQQKKTDQQRGLYKQKKTRVEGNGGGMQRQKWVKNMAAAEKRCQDRGPTYLVPSSLLLVYSTFQKSLFFESSCFSYICLERGRRDIREKVEGRKWPVNRKKTRKTENRSRGNPLASSRGRR